MRRHASGCGRCAASLWRKRSSIDLASLSALPWPAAGVSLATCAVTDHLLGDRLASPRGGAAGVLLVVVGVRLCSLAQAQAQAQRAG